jgi:hypothetical protein
LPGSGPGKPYRPVQGGPVTPPEFLFVSKIREPGVVALVFALAWVAPVVGTTNSACERYPYTSGCR